MSSLETKVTIITGAGSGIGAATAKHFAKLGYWLALCDIQAKGLEKTVQACIELGLQHEKVLSIPGDLTANGVPEQVVSKTIERFGRLDILLNVAGIASGQEFVGMTEAYLDRMLNINFKAGLKLTQLSIPHLKMTKGNIVNVSSSVTFRPLDKNMAYNISKSAVDQFTRSAAIELAPFGIRVNSVNPGPVRTDIIINSGGTKEQSDVVWKRAKESTLLGRLGSPDEIAPVLAFLASDEASFVTGINMLADGGHNLVVPKIYD